MMQEPTIFEPLLPLTGRPERSRIIEKDEIMSLIIDANVLDVDSFLKKHCAVDPQQPLQIPYKRRASD